MTRLEEKHSSAQLASPGSEHSSFAVAGTVTDPNGRPLAGIWIRVVDRDMRHEELLGETRTLANGRYEVLYSAKQFRRAEKLTADLVVRAVDENGNLLAASGTVFNAGEEVTIDLVVPSERLCGSEYERHVRELQPLVGNVLLSELTDEDRAFLVGETGIEADHLRFLQLDAIWSCAHELPLAAFYGLLRQGLPTELRNLLALAPSRLRRALEQSICDRIVPPALAKELDTITGRLETLAVDTSFVAASKGAAPPIGVLLTTSSLTEAQQRQVALFALEHQGEADFWEQLSQCGLDTKAVEHARFTLESSPLLHNHLPVLERVQKYRAAAGWTSVRDLARLARKDWQTIAREVAAQGLPAGFTTAEDFGESIAHVIERALPTAVIHHRLVEDDELGTPDLGAFLGKNASFDLLHAHLDGYLANGAVLDGVQDVAKLREDLGKLQRTARMLPTERDSAPQDGLFAGVRALVSHGFHSAQAITRVGKPVFMKTMTQIMGTTAAEVTFHNAQVRAEATNLVHQRLRDWVIDPLRVIPRVPLPEGDVPSWAEMFGGAGGCECAHCRSVYGPAAYMADLLRFLETAPDTQTKDRVVTRPLDVLFDRARRSDLQHIELSCANATTPLPYIDLVNEILEDAVIGGELTARQTEGTAEALRAEPEHVRPEVQSLLASAVYPWKLPFDFEHERARLLAEHLGIELAPILERFGRTVEESARTSTGMSAVQWALATGRVPDGASTPRWNNLSASALASVPTFLTTSGLSHAELESLTRSWFFSAEGHRALVVDRGSNPCDITDDRLVDLDTELLAQIQRFVTISRHMEWSIDEQSELDAALQGLGLRTLDTDTLVAVTRLHETARRHALTIRALVAFDRPRLARLLRTTEAELDLLADISGAGPLDSLHAILVILEHMDAVRASGLSVREVANLLEGWDQAPSVFTPSDEEMARLLFAIHRFVPVHVEERLQAPEIALEIEASLATFGESLDPALDDEARQARLDAERAAVGAGIAERLSLDAICVALASRLQLDLDVVERLLRPVTDAGGATTAAALVSAESDRTAPGLVDLAFLRLESASAELEDPSSTAVASAKALLFRLFRVARLIDRMQLDRGMLDTIATTRASNGFLDFDDLRSDSTSMPAQRFGGFVTLARAHDLAAQLSTGEHGLFALMADAADGRYDAADLSLPTTWAFLAQQTGWRREDLTTLAGGLAIDAPALRRAQTYHDLRELNAPLQRLRIDAGTLVRWSMPSTSAASLATDFTSIARAQHSDDAGWWEVLTPISDRLREKKRDALLAHLTHARPELDRPDDVYAHFLIDPEMSSCQLTSRIKQANASIQLFVQRILMNLEDRARPIEENADHWQHWAWMKTYRVWEANRKVFLYPENWIEPDLRDDKSPFFEDLENELLQGDVTTESVEQAYRNYVAKVDQVARLEVRGIFHEVESSDEGDAKDILHIVARTYSDPYSYFYRQRDMTTGIFSPWEEITLNIEGDNTLPVVYQGRLLLFWCTLESDGQNQHQLYIHWSERSRGRWNARRTHRLGPPLLRMHSSGSPRVLLRTSVDQEGLHILLFVYDVPVAPFSPANFVFDDYRQTLELELGRSDISILLLPPQTSIRRGNLVSSVGGATAELRVLLHAEGTNTFALPGLATAIDDAEITPREYSDLFISGLGEGVRTYNTLRESSGSIPLLRAAPRGFRLLTDHQSPHVTTEHPFVFEAGSRGYLVTPHDITWNLVAPLGRWGITWRSFRFELLFHPFIREIVKALHRGGVDALLSPPHGPLGHSLDRQYLEEWPEHAETTFHGYDPVPLNVLEPYPLEEIDFSTRGSYSLYNWELFFHIPLLVADRLSQHGRYEEAQRWFHTIFDPTDATPHPFPAKYWKVKPFYQLAKEPPETIGALMEQLARGDADAAGQVEQWRENPFNPHLIARHRLLAYMRAVVMKYLDNLIAWADDLFARDTIESINEATQLYVLAAGILGERALTLRANERPPLDYATLRDRLDAFANALVEVEGLLPADLGGGGSPSGGAGSSSLLLYFCIPHNEKLRGYWDTIADRLFKIRHCQDIEGNARSLPLFEPPIDPALLVRARAAGLDMREALSQTLAVPRPAYRYAALYPRAIEACNELRGLGSALVGALEKKDAEELGQLRARHELAILSQMRFVRESQIEEAEESLEGLRLARAIVQKRLDYYQSREFMNSAERAQLANLTAAHVFESIGQGFNLAASYAHLVPDTKAGAPTTLGSTFGGSNVGNSLRATSGVFSFIASQHSFAAHMSSITGGYLRRQDEWVHQAALAETELEQVDKQIAAAEIRIAIARHELANHERQIEHSREVEDFLRTKFTNRELYGWTVAQLGALHHQAYRLALDLAKRAERAAQHELGLEPTDFTHIGFAHWDGARKGILAAERLGLELRRMDAAFLTKHTREHELTKHVSLATLHPAQLVQLRETGSCSFTIPELVFDLDFPGQYNRRLRAVTVTIPCVTGPFTNVSARLTLEKSWIRIDPTTSGPYPLDPTGDDRFRIEYAPRQSIATSSAQRDAGVFELSFRDERYLPFEGSGAISRWKLELPSTLRQFDYDTISDVVLHLSYAARDGGMALTAHVNDHIRTALDGWLEEVGGRGRGLVRMVSLRQEFSSHWHRFLHPVPEHVVHETTITLERKHFPHFLRDDLMAGGLLAVEAHVVLQPKLTTDGPRFAGRMLELGRETMSAQPLSVDGSTSAAAWGGLPVATFPLGGAEATASWTLRLDPELLAADPTSATLTTEVDGRRRLRADVLDDLLVFVVLASGS